MAARTRLSRRCFRIRGGRRLGECSMLDDSAVPSITARKLFADCHQKLTYGRANDRPMGGGDVFAVTASCTDHFVARTGPLRIPKEVGREPQTVRCPHRAAPSMRMAS